MSVDSTSHGGPFNVEPFRVRMVRQTAAATLARFDHPVAAALPVSFSAHQAAARFRVNIVERGWFRLRYGKREWSLGAGSIFLSRPNDEYRYSHFRHLDPDTCLRLEYSTPLPEEVAERFNRLPLVLPQTNRLAFLRLQLSSLRADDAELALDTVACDIVDAARRASDSTYCLYRPKQLAWYAERVAAVRAVIDADPAAEHTLSVLASRVAMSPFHFARVFGELVGLPPHRYLVRVRLRRARELLQSGMSVTEACERAGFNNLSHFVRTFRAHYGVIPSSLKMSRKEPRRPR